VQRTACASPRSCRVTNPDAQKYFNACAPTDCTTRRVEKMSVTQVISVVLGLLGGLSVTLRTVVGVFYNVTWSMCFQKHCCKKKAVTVTRVAVRPPQEKMHPITAGSSAPV
jgi:hypothetical protein